WGLVLGATAVPAIPRLSQHTTATVFGQISIQPPQDASYHVGDSLLLARIDRDVASWGDVVVPVGVARVTDVQKRQLLGDVIMQFGRIHDGNLAMPLEPFKDAGDVRPVPVGNGLEAHVIAQRDLHVLTNAQQILFLDRGRAEGVVPGDLFEIYRPASRELGGASEQPLIVVEIVHTREHSCSGLVLGITHPGVSPGSPRPGSPPSSLYWPCSSSCCSSAASCCCARRRWRCLRTRWRRVSSGLRCCSASRRGSRPPRGAPSRPCCT